MITPPVLTPLREALLRRRAGASLLASDDGASRALVFVIAILSFLAALAAAGAEIVAESSLAWRSALAREATVQLRPVEGQDIEANLARALALARATEGVASAELVPKAQSERLLEPWLGRDLDLSDLPIPRLVVLKLDPARQPDLAGLAERLGGIAGASLDDHAAWLSRLSVMARTILGVAIGFVALVLLASGLAVAFATRGVIAGSRDLVEVLHYVGATDRFIAREFALRFAGFGLKGGLAGCAAAAVLLVAAGFVSDAARSGASGDQLQALFGSVELGLTGLAALVSIAPAVAATSGLVSAMAVKRFLKLAH